MKVDMFLHESAHKVITVIIPLSIVDLYQRISPLCLPRCLLKVLDQQLALLVEVVSGTDVDSDAHGTVFGVGGDEVSGVVLGPDGGCGGFDRGGGLGGAEVAGECLLAPGAGGGVGNGGKCRGGEVFPGVFEVLEYVSRWDWEGKHLGSMKDSGKEMQKGKKDEQLKARRGHPLSGPSEIPVPCQLLESVRG